jgi:hypothetical protein
MKLSSKVTFLFLAFFCLILGFCFTSCVDENDYTSSPAVELKFSADTLMFDTVFTTIGSVTKTLMVYNNENQAVKIDRITLGSGSASFYRLNVDGDTSLVARDIEIGARDSLYIFVRLELDYNNQSNPLLVEDSIEFFFNNKSQKVLLQAYGQDAYYHKPSHYLLSSNQSGEYDTIWFSMAHENPESCGVIVNGNDIEWKSDKPHVVLGVCAVDSAYTLNLGANTRIHFQNSAEFWVYKDATLKAEGDVSQPIVFQGLRLDEYYKDIPGQWGSLRFWAGSKDNILNNVVVKNATIGVLVDTCVTSNPTIEVMNTRIENCSYIGLYSRGAVLDMKNSLIQNCGSYNLALTLGGSYQFVHCSFANYWRYKTRTTPLLYFNDYYLDVNSNVQFRQIEKAEFYNCIVYGALADSEIEFDMIEQSLSTIRFDYCLVKYEGENQNANLFTNSILNQEPMFVEPSEGDLHLQENSPCIGKGNGIWGYNLPYDIEGNYRLDPPSIGAYEYKPQTNQKFLRKKIK